MIFDEENTCFDGISLFAADLLPDKRAPEIGIGDTAEFTLDIILKHCFVYQLVKYNLMYLLSYY